MMHDASTEQGTSPGDVDILIEWTPPNMARLAAALGELDARLCGDAAELLDVDPRDPDDLYNGGNFTLRTAAGGLDLFDPAEIPGGRPYEEMRPRRPLSLRLHDRLPGTGDLPRAVLVCYKITIWTL